MIMLGVALAHVLQLILWFCDTFTVSFMGLSQSISIHNALADDGSTAVSVIVIVLLVAAAGFAALKHFGIALGNLKIGVLQKVFTVIASAAAMLIIIANYATAMAQAPGMPLSFSFGAILSMLLSVATIALVIYTAVKNKKAK